MISWHIRLYTQADQADVLRLFQLNCPRYFSVEEEADFIYYLAHEREAYFVLQVDDRIIGAGGVNYIKNSQDACLSWGMIHPDEHGKGYGRALSLHRVEYLCANPRVQRILVRTAQFTFGFYEKLGFQLMQIVPDYWAKGYDLYKMEYVR